MSNPHSTAHIAGHPIHPMLVPLPIAFFVAAFLCDLGYWQTANAAWATAAIWLLGAGLLSAAAAAVVGAIDFLGDQRIRALNDAWWHAGGNVVVVLIELYNWYARYAEGTAAVVPKGLLLSLIAVAILGFTGWKGGELVFRHRVAVADETATPRESQTTSSPRRAA
jgi:uncharacterized membrane protein